MQIGKITVGGRDIGLVMLTEGEPERVTPTAGSADYVPEGRAEGRGPSDYSVPGGGASPRVSNNHHYPGHPAGRHDAAPQPVRQRFGGEGDLDPLAPGPTRPTGRIVHRGSPEVDKEIVGAAKAYHLDPNFMRSVASIESNNDPESNRNKDTKYKGLYQVGTRGEKNEWERFGQGGDPYSAHDNAMAAARMFDANRTSFRKNFGRDPTDTEMYLMHQQGLGFYTQGTMTNVGGNPYPGMRGPQTHDSFEQGWGREIERRKEQLSNPMSIPSAATSSPAYTGPSTGGGRLVGNVDSRVDPRIPEIVGAAATHLPPGYKVEMTSGFRGAGQANHNGRAADFHIIDPDGNTLRNRGEDPGGMYQLLARHAHGEQQARHPELNGQFAWGGAFGTALGGGGERDLMHFDINGERGRYEQYQLRNMGSVPGFTYGKQASPERSPAPEQQATKDEDGKL
ncbi:hypothetical protein HAP48_0042420 [Bradyrhizobium septentrionale]|uniref:Uncharacterized protein n=1 Tax=Bradyrhizobium septentrionale TaxID=1404411 RepID=A0A973W2V0_9BRAD|nr:hypothetical protein [Bradyrhizobium septentrionale]UGY15114.1 hypothetical protein HAP48_0042420 [Bradyrhizobium septentrionale]